MNKFTTVLLTLFVFVFMIGCDNNRSSDTRNYNVSNDNDVMIECNAFENVDGVDVCIY